MKLVIEKINNICHYCFNDDDVLTMHEKEIVTPHFIIGHLNIFNAEIVENVNDIPDDWVASKYAFISGNFVLIDFSNDGKP